MEAPIPEDKLNTRRKAVVLKGFPLLALSFQTLGMLCLFQPPTILELHAMFRYCLLRYWHSEHCPPFHEASSSTDILIQSPLYALNGIWSTAPSAEDVVGGISAIIWALTLLPLLKYVSVLTSEVVHV